MKKASDLEEKLERLNEHFGFEDDEEAKLKIFFG